MPDRAGWYPDPSNPNTLRWWDGKRWRAPAFTPPAGSEPTGPTPIVTGLVGPGGPESPSPYTPPAGMTPMPLNGLAPVAPPRRSQRGLWFGAGAAVGLVVVAVVAFVVLRSDPAMTFDGQSVDEPETTLTGAEDTLESIVDDRHGALHDDSRCYFVRMEPGGKDVDRRVVCGPVLFVDGDPDQNFLAFPLQAEPADDDAVRLVASDQPSAPEPSALNPDDELYRPDGSTPPDDGELAVPDPPRAEEGLFQADPLDGVELEDPGPDAQIVAFGSEYSIVGLAEPERFGQGDEARRPAEDERFVAFELERGLGIGFTANAPVAEVQVGDAPPQPLPSEASDPMRMILSVPDDIDVVDLVVNDRGIVQRVSLLDGEPAPGNIAVLRRDNRSQVVGASAEIGFVASAPGFITESFGVSLTVSSVELVWYFGLDGAQHPADPNRAWLVPVLDYVWGPGTGQTPNTGLEASVFSIVLPDGSVVAAADLVPEPETIIVAFDVPADFTTGTIQVGGQINTSDGVLLDFGAGQLQAGVNIPAG